MFEAILAAIITVVLVACVAILIFIFRSSKGSEIQAHKGLDKIDNVGLGTSTSPIKTKESAPIHAGGVHVKSAEESLAKPGDKISRRFAAFGAFIGLVFATLTGKLWSMQLVGSETYVSEAENNLYTTVSTPAPRGIIYDKNGKPLVKNKTIQTVLADSTVADDPDVMKRLSAVLGVPLGVIRQSVLDESLGAQSQRIVQNAARLRDVAFISENHDAFPGINIEERTIREYPYGALASHVLGYVGSPTDDDLEDTVEGRDIESSDVIGKSGIEHYYDGILSGDKGSRKMIVDASGNVVNVVSEVDSKKGSDIYLTIDAHAQYVADRLLAKTVAPEGDIGSGKGISASIVAMDVNTGGIAVMANYPTYDPSYLTDGIPQDLWELYNSEESHSPFLNRAINGQYPPASTFKAFTSMAGLSYGFASFGTLWKCAGKWDGFGSGDIQKCWNTGGHGMLDLHDGIVNSCDVVFYDIAKCFYDAGPDGTNQISGTALQEYLQLYNFGAATGIDLDGESEGRIPTPEWKAEQWRNVPSEAMWRGGDYSNMIIGQGDVLVTPIQLACAYCGIATGKILKPHLINKVLNSTGEVVYEAPQEVITTPDVDANSLQYVRKALHDMIPSNEKLDRIFKEMGLNAAAKSGTAEHTDRMDDAWFAAYAPYDKPKYVCVCVVEQGGGGSDVAGPIVAKVLGALFDKNPDNLKGVGYISGSSGKSLDVKFTGNEGRTD